MGDVYKIAAWVPLSHELWEEIDQAQRPWVYPDHRVLPEFDLFPRWTRVEAWWREWRQRFVDVRLALHGRLRDEGDTW